MAEPLEFTHGREAPKWYEIRMTGHLHPRWAERLEGMSFTCEEDGSTLLAGPVCDQAALHGLLRKVRDLGLPLISVLEVEPQSP